MSRDPVAVEDLLAKTAELQARSPRTQRPDPILDRKPAGHDRETLWRNLVWPRFAQAHLDDLDGDAAARLRGWLDADRPGALVLHGPVGVGKTHAAVAVAREVFYARRSVELHSVPELLDRMRPGGDEGMADRLAETDLLVLDDLGAERGSEWAVERLYVAVNRRWTMMRPIVATTNLTAGELIEALGERAVSRLFDAATFVGFAGGDRRR